MTIHQARWLFVFVLVAIVTSSTGPQLVDARGITPGKFYFVSMDNQTQDNSIWEGDGSTLDVRRIWTVQRFDAAQTPKDVFSQHELSVLSTTNTFNLKVDSAGVSRFINEIWLLDTTRLLVLTNTRACDQPLQGCFGFYEFLILDVQTGSVSSLLKIDLHDAMFPNCGYLDALWFGSVEINPSPLIEKFAITVWPDSSCIGLESSAQTRLVDYSTSPVTLTALPTPHGLTWSPDGRQFAYYTRDNCSREVCTVSIKVATLDSKAESQVVYQAIHYYPTPVFVGWLDNSTLIYQVSTDSEIPLHTFWYDIVDDSRGEFPIPDLFTLSNLSFLSDGVQSNIIAADNYRYHIIGFSPQHILPTIIDFPELQGLYYNPRYNRYAATHIEGTTINLIDAELTQSTINLTRFGLVAPNEVITWFTSGDLVTAQATQR